MIRWGINRVCLLSEKSIKYHKQREAGHVMLVIFMLLSQNACQKQLKRPNIYFAQGFNPYFQGSSRAAHIKEARK